MGASAVISPRKHTCWKTRRYLRPLRLTGFVSERKMVKEWKIEVKRNMEALLKLRKEVLSQVIAS